ncbi:hypothetical protein CR513_39967, partial [Mucuna pruriens]
MCSKCKKPGHFKSKCLNLEKEKEKMKSFIKKKKKDEDEEANLCLMEDTPSDYENDKYENFKNLKYLQIAYQEFLSNLSTFSLGYKELKIFFSKLSKEFKSLKKKCLCSKTSVQRKKVELPSENNPYKIDLTNPINQNITCLMSINDDHWMWHKKFGHASLRLISKLKKHNLVRGLPSLVYKVDLLCDACQKGKQIRGYFEFKNIVSTFRPLELLHTELFGPTKSTSVGGKHYGLIIDESFMVFFVLCKHVQNEKGINIVSIREVVNTTCYLQNRIYIKPILKKTPYELWKGRQPNISCFYPFGCECFILNTKDNLGKFYLKLDKETFRGYLITSKAYRVYNIMTLKVEKHNHVKFNDCKPDKELSKLNDFLAYLNIGNLKTPSKEHSLDNKPKVGEAEISSRNWQLKSYHPK